MTKWNKRQRLEAAIAGEIPDRIPVALWRHWPGDDQDAGALAAAHLKWQHDYDWDLLKVGPSSSYSVVDWGVRDRWVGHIEGTREYVRRPIQQPADWEKLAPLDPYQGMLAKQLKALHLIGEELAGETPFITTIFAPLSQAKHLADNPAMLSHLRSHPDAFRRGLETITESTIRFIEAAKETGISGIYYAIQHARYPQMSPAEYEMWARPYDLQILEAAGDLWLNILHIHSSDIMFDELADYPTAIVNWHDRETGLSLRRGLQKIKGAASGGVDHWTLHQESPEQTLEEIEDAIAQTNGRRLLLGTGCVAMVTTPLRNIRALRESVERR
ncbi:MAG: uroporphyrinogen decarboxylase [Ardenticatenaceae bacterium]|nr:uroporphyrinogen decarboxylase [Ardenticatenaceae bacterium]MCB9443605.1 uroporphyrinogen decarboxylase [Ardenticatenaceae bacterium]